MSKENVYFCQEMRRQLSDIQLRINRLTQRSISPIGSQTSSIMSEQSQISNKASQFALLQPNDDIQKNIVKINDIITQRRLKTEELLKFQY